MQKHLCWLHFSFLWTTQTTVIYNYREDNLTILIKLDDQLTISCESQSFRDLALNINTNVAINTVLANAVNISLFI